MNSGYNSNNTESQLSTRPPKKQPALSYRHSQSWSTASSDVLRSYTPVQSPPAQPHPPLPTRTPPLSSAKFTGFYQQSPSPAAMYSQQQQQQAYPTRPDAPQRTPSQNATLTLGSFAPLPVPSPSPGPSDLGGRSASSASGRSAYYTPLTTPGYDAMGAGASENSSSRMGLAAPIALAPQATYPSSSGGGGDPYAGNGAQPSFGSMMHHPHQQGYEGSQGAYYPDSQGMYGQHPSASMGIPPAAAGGAASTSLSRNPSTAYAGSSLLNSPPPTGLLPNSNSSPPPAGFSSSTMMHDPNTSLHSRTGSQHALQQQSSPAQLAQQQQMASGGRTTPGLGGKGGLLGPSNSTRVVNKHLIPSKNSGIFMAVILVEAIAVTTMVVIVFALIEARIKIKVQYLKTVPVYLAIFVLGMVFEFIVALDAVRLKNTIQVVGVAIFNVALTVTAALEITQVRDALERQDLDFGGIPCKSNPTGLCSAVDELYPIVQRFLIVVPILTGLAQIPLVILSYYLFKDFGWAIYRKIGADLRIRNMFMWYQVFVVWLKFDFFFGGAFTIAYLIIVANKDDWEYPLTIAAVPAAFLILLLAAFAVRREVHFLMWVCIGGFIAGIVYFLYKLASIFVPRTANEYTTVRLTLPFFSIFATVSLMFTLINACICLYNFGKGLREAHDSFGSFGGLWNNSRTRRGGGLRDSLGNRIGRSPSAANQLSRFNAAGGGGYSEGKMGEGKSSLNTSMDSSTGMKRVMMGGGSSSGVIGNGVGGMGMGMGNGGVIGEEDPGMFEMTGNGGTVPPRRPRISID
ncbi:hypothetical protein CF327_g40 [Tilletia walkeri]|uniref:Uncharacterized protein n=1 Tax=Tilletia walkeri TaxID=117179 RepID=A0A8X7T7X7_9BASI|nr:hypothetical protein CF327_g40 [Tilletia walkeri]KAE8272277.1 hypothetical protein A4X09_0g52 [Tilletia walkeri]